MILGHGVIFRHRYAEGLVPVGISQVLDPASCVVAQCGIEDELAGPYPIGLGFEGWRVASIVPEDNRLELLQMFQVASRFMARRIDRITLVNRAYWYPVVIVGGDVLRNRPGPQADQAWQFRHVPGPGFAVSSLR